MLDMAVKNKIGTVQCMYNAYIYLEDLLNIYTRNANNFEKLKQTYRSIWSVKNTYKYPIVINVAIFEIIYRPIYGNLNFGQ